MLDKLKKTQIVKFFSNLKFAVTIILVFAGLMIFGTFQESYHGTEYANRFVYKNWYFILTQILLFSSVFSAALVRLPLKSRLYGFYTVHSGILMMGFGSLITYEMGIDGSIQLNPEKPTNVIVEPKDLLLVENESEQTQKEFALPASHLEKELDLNFGGVKVIKYLPFAYQKLSWDRSDKKEASIHFSLANQFVKEQAILSRHPKSNYPNRMSLGPLTIISLPKASLPCFRNPTSKQFIFDHETSTCIPVDIKNAQFIRSLSIQGQEMISYTSEKETFVFYPEISTRPLDANKKQIEKPRFELFTAKTKGPNLLIFEDEIAYFFKNEFITQNLKQGVAATLPWMNIQFLPIRLEKEMYPFVEPTYIIPLQEEGKIIQGDFKAIQVEFNKEKQWILNDETKTFNTENGKINISLTSKTIQLPYEITLNRFQMNKYPGTDQPSSFESFIKVSEEPNSTHHVFMNNPFKKNGLTFYQASYFPVGPEQFGSILSVNFDPGRAFKYLGSFLIVFGAIWHYYITRQKTVRTHA